MPESVASVQCFSCAYSSLSCHTWDCTNTSPVSPITDLMHSFISLVWELPVPSRGPSLPDSWQMFNGGVVSNQTASTFKLPQTAFWSRSPTWCRPRTLFVCTFVAVNATLLCLLGPTWTDVSFSPRTGDWWKLPSRRINLTFTGTHFRGTHI